MIIILAILIFNFKMKSDYTSIGPGKTLCKGVANYKQEDFTFYVQIYEKDFNLEMFFIENKKKTQYVTQNQRSEAFYYLTREGGDTKLCFKNIDSLKIYHIRVWIVQGQT